jgi:Reverse transcriptase (RNA-dependent DNA polymerase)
MTKWNSFTYRLCVQGDTQSKQGENRYVNKDSLGDAYPISDPSGLIQKMGQVSYIAMFDAQSGYHQTIVNPAHRWLIAFVCDEGLLEWVSTPFGLQGACYTFVRMLQRIWQPVKQFTASFIDDMSVFSNSWEQHLNHIKRYLKTINAAGLTFNLNKSSLAQSEVRFLGYKVGSGRRVQIRKRLVQYEIWKRLPPKIKFAQF